MDFQGHQEEAKQNTFKLVALLTAGVIAIIAVVSLLLFALFYYDSGSGDPLTAVAIATPITLVGIGGASLVKTSQLRSGGGSYVASSLGGRQIDFNTMDPAERQLGNVVEEMAIAAGMPVPAVFVLDDEPGINAFAAGWTADTAAIGVTRGALTYLNRRELQGVIAHEFSHIANGDTRIKTRIIGWIFGITVLTLLGRLLLQHTMWAPRRRDSKDNSALVMAGIGIALMIVGGLGTLFARMIQAAVSRQREFLADASAVQYTRDPSSIGEALIKIASVGSDNKVRTAHATEASHLFFSSALSASFATHPPLKQRIKRLMPEWNGEFVELDPDHGAVLDSPASGFAPGTAAAAPSSPPHAPARPQPSAARYQPPSMIGPTDAHVKHSRTLIAQIPPQTQHYLRTHQGAVAAVMGSLVSDNPATRDDELARVGQFLSMYPADLSAAGATISSLDRILQLPAIDIALQAIRQTPGPYRERLAEAIRELEASQSEGDVFRWVLRRVMLRHLEDQRDDGTRRREVRIETLADDATTVLAILAYFNSAGATQTQASFEAALATIGVAARPLPPNDQLTYERLDAALEHLGNMELASRRAFVEAATAVVMHDQMASADEAELLRVVADAVRLPVPPLLPA
ncbi:MAG: M48 family metalloprotease [Actinomycetia bacterium]|nr:M48 family metalloprotease [Actinomycetes bacterium]